MSLASGEGNGIDEPSGPATAIDGHVEQDTDESPAPQGYEQYDEPELI